MAAIAARFGGEAVTALRHLLGEAGQADQTAHQAVAPILAERRFAEPVARTEYALEVLGELAAEAARQLEQVQAGGRRFEASLLPQRRAGASALPSRPASRPAIPQLVIRLMSERIEGLSDPIDPGFGFDLIRLSVPVVEPLAAAQLRLEGGAARDAEVAALIDRLSTRLGRNRVRRLVAGRHPYPRADAARFAGGGGGQPGRRTGPCPSPGEPPLRPLHLFDPPQPIEVIAEVPDGPPHRFRWRRKLSMRCGGSKGRSGSHPNGGSGATARSTRPA